jgi:hypothetical protein
MAMSVVRVGELDGNGRGGSNSAVKDVRTRRAVAVKCLFLAVIVLLLLALASTLLSLLSQLLFLLPYFPPPPLLGAKRVSGCGYDNHPMTIILG